MSLEQAHKELVRTLAKPGEDILSTLTPEKCHILHMSMGLAGEVGEVIDLVKKVVFYDKVVDSKKFIEEFGDVEFYLRGLRDAIGVTRKSVLAGNIDKLNDRYSSGSYSDEQAINRADKQ